MQRDDLFDEHASALTPNAGLVRDLAAMRRELIDPLRINPGDGAGEKAATFRRFRPRQSTAVDLIWASAARSSVVWRRGLSPVCRRVRKTLSREHRDVAIARRFVEIALFATGDVADQTGQDRAMDGVVGGVAFVDAGQRAEVVERVVELGVKVLPLAHPEIGEKVLTAEPAALALAAKFFHSS